MLCVAIQVAGNSNNKTLQSFSDVAFINDICTIGVFIRSARVNQRPSNIESSSDW
jgi:hypothetical protein